MERAIALNSRCRAGFTAGCDAGNVDHHPAASSSAPARLPAAPAPGRRGRASRRSGCAAGRPSTFCRRADGGLDVGRGVGGEAGRGGDLGERGRIVRGVVGARDRHGDDAAHQAAEVREEAGASFWPIMPTTRPTGLGARSSSSASVWAMAWAPAGIVAAVEPQLGARRRAGATAGRCRAAACAPASAPRGGRARWRASVRPSGLSCRAAAIGRAGVGDLVVAHQRRQRQVHQPLRALVDEPAALLEGLVVLAPDERAARRHLRRAARMTASASGGWREMTAVTPRLEDAGLLAGDLGERRAELVGVVERDRRDDA